MKASYAIGITAFTDPGRKGRGQERKSTFVIEGEERSRRITLLLVVILYAN
jgi:hypothetical protein